jgi:GNAT superfamily N-acetyltransferase
MPAPLPDHVPSPSAAPIGPILRLGDATMEECLALAVDRQWQPEGHKWQLIFDLGEVWGVRDASGALIGTATATRFGDVIAIGNVLVARRAEGRGIGRRLMEHILTRHSGAVVILNATVFGRPLYEKLGFRAVGSTHTHRGLFVPDAGGEEFAARRGEEPRVRAATPADLPAIARLDAEVYGANREPLLRRVTTSFADVACVSERGGVVTGFGARWSTIGYSQIGPLLASDDAEAAAIIAALAREVRGELRVDLNDRDAALRAWAVASGLGETGASALMVRGALAFPGTRLGWYSALMQAIG